MLSTELPPHQLAMLELGYGPKDDNENQRMLWFWPHPCKLQSPVSDSEARTLHKTTQGDIVAMFATLAGWERVWIHGNNVIRDGTAAGIYEKRKLAIPF
jgi:hypothetical protein